MYSNHFRCLCFKSEHTAVVCTCNFRCAGETLPSVQAVRRELHLLFSLCVTFYPTNGGVDTFRHVRFVGRERSCSNAVQFSNNTVQFLLNYYRRYWEIVVIISMVIVIIVLLVTFFFFLLLYIVTWSPAGQRHNVTMMEMMNPRFPFGVRWIGSDRTASVRSGSFWGFVKHPKSPGSRHRMTNNAIYELWHIRCSLSWVFFFSFALYSIKIEGELI